jgi:hypothetical protein
LKLWKPISSNAWVCLAPNFFGYQVQALGLKQTSIKLGLFELLPNKWIFQTKIWDIVSLQSCHIVQEKFFKTFFVFIY